MRVWRTFLYRFNYWPPEQQAMSAFEEKQAKIEEEVRGLEVTDRNSYIKLWHLATDLSNVVMDIAQAYGWNDEHESISDIMQLKHDKDTPSLEDMAKLFERKTEPYPHYMRGEWYRFFDQQMDMNGELMALIPV
jgi:hypothetical protein